MASRAVAGNWTTFRSKEMWHEEIHHRSRADLADRDPVAHRDCKCSPRVPVELLIRQQRLLTISRASERFCSRITTWHSCGRLAVASRPPSCCKVNLADEALLLAAVPAVGLINGAVGCTMNARAIKAKQRRLKLVALG